MPENKRAGRYLERRNELIRLIIRTPSAVNIPATHCVLKTIRMYARMSYFDSERISQNWEILKIVFGVVLLKISELKFCFDYSFNLCGVLGHPLNSGSILTNSANFSLLISSCRASNSLRSASLKQPQSFDGFWLIEDLRISWIKFINKWLWMVNYVWRLDCSSVLQRESVNRTALWNTT